MASPCEIKWPKVILYGDSITQKSFSYDGGWGTELQNSLMRRCDVVNRGFGGYNTRWNKILLPRIFPAREAPSIHIVIILLGTNDSNLPGGHAYVPLEEYRTNLVAIIDYLMAIGVKRDHIMLIDPPAVDPGRTLEETEEKDDYVLLRSLGAHTIENTRKYSHACVEVAKKWRVGYIHEDGLFEAMMACPNWKDMLVDGVHFTHLGSEFLFKLLWPWVSAKCKGLKQILPSPGDIPIDDPESVLTQGGR